MKQILPARIIPTRFHGMLDYFFAFVMITAPSIGRFSDKVFTMLIFVLLGLLMVVNSLFTKYEHGPFPIITMKNHLKIDKAIGGLLIVCPWLSGGDGVIIGMITGGLVIATAYMSDETVPVQKENRDKASAKRSSLSRGEIYRLYGRSKGGRR